MVTRKKIQELCSTIVSGGTPSTQHKEWYDGDIPWLNTKEVKFNKIESTERSITSEGLANCSAKWVPANTVVVAMYGATAGNVAITGIPLTTNQACCNLIINPDVADYRYVYYALMKANKQLKSLANGGAQQNLSVKQIKDFAIPVPCIDEQREIAEILYKLDEKINLNSKINDNLQQQVMTLYRQMFVENTNDVRRECRADEYFDISIGKTPPRKEPQWFSENPVDHVWVSISDMGSCGLFIAKSSEYLTHEAVERFNVKVVPDNTVLLSFKLTVGRIAITDGEMTTNEAIAHFKTNKPEINEYLFCYLKNFNYQTMGSTSSIATAVNSKIIKGMPFVVPTDDELEAFHGFAEPIFAMIKRNQRENTQLTTLRNTLLAKLMSGEIDVSGIQL